MRINQLLVLCAICVWGLLTPTVVQAVDIDTFVFHNWADGILTWQLPASPIIPPGDVYYGDFQIENVPYSWNGVPQEPTTFYFISGPSGGLMILDPDGYCCEADTPANYGNQLFSGPPDAPTFVPGTYNFGNYYPGGAYGIITITNPEPSTLLLMGIGMLALLGFARKKIAA